MKVIPMSVCKTCDEVGICTSGCLIDNCSKQTPRKANPNYHRYLAKQANRNLVSEAKKL
jgi:hypothetical protein